MLNKKLKTPPKQIAKELAKLQDEHLPKLAEYEKKLETLDDRNSYSKMMAMGHNLRKMVAKGAKNLVFYFLYFKNDLEKAINWKLLLNNNYKRINLKNLMTKEAVFSDSLLTIVINLVLYDCQGAKKHH